MSGYRVIGGGSGGGGSANVQWGPDFGGVDGDRYNIGVQTEMPALGVFHVRQIGVGHTMPALAVLYTEQGIGINHSMSLGLSGSHGIGIAHAMPVLGPNYNAQGIGVQATMPALALSHSKSVGIHLSGSVLGAPFFRAVESEGTSSSASSLVINKPAGTIEGDFLLAIIGHNTTANTITPPAGWTEIRNDVSGANRLWSFYKVAGSSEPSSYTFNFSASNAMIGTIITFIAVDTGTPVDAHGGQTGTATDPVAPSITTTVVNTMKICACVQQNTVNADYTPPANYTERSDLNGNGALGALTITGETATRVQAATGASGTVTMNSTQALGSAYSAQHIALRPVSLEIAA